MFLFKQSQLITILKKSANSRILQNFTEFYFKNINLFPRVFEEYSDIFSILLLYTLLSIIFSCTIYIYDNSEMLLKIDTFKMEIQNVKCLFLKPKIAFKIYFLKTLLYLNSFHYSITSSISNAFFS